MRLPTVNDAQYADKRFKIAAAPERINPLARAEDRDEHRAVRRFRAAYKLAEIPPEPRQFLR